MSNVCCLCHDEIEDDGIMACEKPENKCDILYHRSCVETMRSTGYNRCPICRYKPNNRVNHEPPRNQEPQNEVINIIKNDLCLKIIFAYLGLGFFIGIINTVTYKTPYIVTSLEFNRTNELILNKDKKYKNWDATSSDIKQCGWAKIYEISNDSSIVYGNVTKESDEYIILKWIPCNSKTDTYLCDKYRYSLKADKIYPGEDPYTFKFWTGQFLKQAVVGFIIASFFKLLINICTQQ